MHRRNPTPATRPTRPTAGRWFLLVALLLTGPAVAAAAAAVVPRRRPTLVQISAWADNPLTARSVAVTAVLAAALIWTILAAAAVVSILAAAPRPTAWLTCLPLPHPVKTVLLALAGTAALGTAATAATQQPAAATTGTDDPTRPGTDEHQPPSQSATVSTTAGLGLADGSWIPRPLAETITAAAAALWWRRRRDYRPLTAPAALRDADLPAPSRTVAAVTAHLATDSEPTDHDAPISAPTGPLPPPMPVARLPMGGLTLTGDGAPAAVRGILISTLLDRQTRILTTETTLNILLGPHRPTDMPRIDVASLEEVFERLDGERTGPTITILEITHHDDTARLTELLHTRSAVAVILGDGRARTAWHVDDDGTTHTRDGHPPPRLCVLTTSAANDLLALAAAANGDDPPESRPYAAAHNAAGGNPLPAPVSTTASDRPDRLRLRLLGRLALEYHDAPIHIRRSAGWQILAYLAIHPAGATSRQLITAIWPHLHPTTITGRLYTTINELRKTVPTPDAATIIERDGESYRLNPEIIDVDLWHLTTAHQTAETLPPNQARTAALRALIGSYRGELAAGRQWPWLTQPRETIHRHVIDAYTALTETSTPTEVIDLLRHATKIDPVNRHLQHRLHEALQTTHPPT